MEFWMKKEAQKLENEAQKYHDDYVKFVEDFHNYKHDDLRTIWNKKEKFHTENDKKYHEALVMLDYIGTHPLCTQKLENKIYNKLIENIDKIYWKI